MTAESDHAGSPVQRFLRLFVHLNSIADRLFAPATAEPTCSLSMRRRYLAKRAKAIASAEANSAFAAVAMILQSRRGKSKPLSCAGQVSRTIKSTYLALPQHDCAEPKTPPLPTLLLADSVPVPSNATGRPLTIINRESSTNRAKKKTTARHGLIQPAQRVADTSIRPGRAGDTSQPPSTLEAPRSPL